MVINNPNWQCQQKSTYRDFRSDTVFATKDITLHTDDNLSFVRKVSYRKELPSIDPNLSADMFSVRYCLDNNIPLQPISNFSENSEDPQTILNNMQNLSNKLNSLTNNNQ